MPLQIVSPDSSAAPLALSVLAADFILPSSARARMLFFVLAGASKLPWSTALTALALAPDFIAPCSITRAGWLRRTSPHHPEWPRKRNQEMPQPGSRLHVSASPDLFPIVELSSRTARAGGYVSDHARRPRWRRPAPAPAPDNALHSVARRDHALQRAMGRRTAPEHTPRMHLTARMCDNRRPKPESGIGS
jgi:hypothetical protein